MLEGIALVGDPKFAIVDQSYPYVARQLLASKSPRLREALKYTIYGKSGRFNAERLIDLLVRRCMRFCIMQACKSSAISPCPVVHRVSSCSKVCGYMLSGQHAWLDFDALWCAT